MSRKTSTADEADKPKRKSTRRKKAAKDLDKELNETEPKMEDATEQVMEDALAAIKAESEDIQTEAEDKPKPKRKPAAKKRSTKKGSVVSMDSVAKARAAEEKEVEEDPVRPAYAPTFSERIDEMRDIKPKQTADATFLIPEKFSFDLIEKKRKSKKDHSWVKKTAYILGGVIILLVIVLIALTLYSSRLLSQESDLASVADTDQNAEAQVSGAAKLALANVPADLQSLLASGMQADLKTVALDSTPVEGLPAVDTDTLFFKSSVQSQTTPLLDFLAKYGIKAQIQQKDDLQSDMALYLVTTLKNPDLSMLTSAVYNATGKAGDAKRVCGILQKAKVVSCQALNATSNQTGSTVFYKDVKAVFTMKRMPEFAKATYQKSSADQVEDIRVVAGK